MLQRPRHATCVAHADMVGLACSCSQSQGGQICAIAIHSCKGVYLFTAFVRIYIYTFVQQSSLLCGLPASLLLCVRSSHLTTRHMFAVRSADNGQRFSSRPRRHQPHGGALVPDGAALPHHGSGVAAIPESRRREMWRLRPLGFRALGSRSPAACSDRLGAQPIFVVSVKVRGTGRQWRTD